jgi:hypothetical protein
MNRICGTAPVENPKNYVPTLPDGLADVIAQALEKDINKRFETMHEMARALEKALAEIVASGDDIEGGSGVVLAVRMMARTLVSGHGADQDETAGQSDNQR